MVRTDDVARMRGEVLFEGSDAGRKLAGFWVLILLSALIATAGIIADSTATVIGAMIVAPLMTPILGTIYSVVTGDSANTARSLGLAVSGALTVVLIGWLSGHISPIDVVAQTNSQVAQRVHPHLIDLIAALATGAVGAFALVRADIGGALPGVAIAISLVPPLAVVGLTAEAGAYGQAMGAALLFLTNVCAMLFSGLIVLLIYRVPAAAAAAGGSGAVSRRGVAFVVAGLIVVAVPLSILTVSATTEKLQEADISTVANGWATPREWRVTAVDATGDGYRVDATGPSPAPDPQLLRRALDKAGFKSTAVVVELSPLDRVQLPTR